MKGLAHDSEDEDADDGDDDEYETNEKELEDHDSNEDGEKPLSDDDGNESEEGDNSAKMTGGRKMLFHLTRYLLFSFDEQLPGNQVILGTLLET